MCRDLIVHVLDAAGRREEQLAELGGCIRRNVLAPGGFTPLLGSGLDASAAVALDAKAALDGLMQKGWTCAQGPACDAKHHVLYYDDYCCDLKTGQWETF